MDRNGYIRTWSDTRHLICIHSITKRLHLLWIVFMYNYSKLPDWRKVAACLIFACLWSEILGHAQPMDIIVWHGDVNSEGFHLGDEVEIQGWDDWPGRCLRFHVGADQGHRLPPRVAHGTDLRLGLVVGRLARGDGAGREQRDAVLWPRKEFQSEERLSPVEDFF